MKKIILLLFLASQAYAQDVSGSEDHPLITRFPGSEITRYYQRDYNEIKMATQPGAAEKPPKAFLIAAGKHTSIRYKCPEKRTALEVMKNYQEALQKSGAEILFQCAGNGCDGTDAWYYAQFFKSVYGSRKGDDIDHYFVPFDYYNEAQRYLVAKLPTPEADYLVEIGVTRNYENPVEVMLEIVAQEKMDEGLIAVSADVIKDKLAKDGKIALYGIFFDTGKSIIKPESAKELSIVNDFLKANPTVKLYVTGHTDDVGSFESNQKLSLKRAAAIVNYLISTHHVASDRLMALGAGPSAPASTNRSEEGRAKNRRVELVERLK